MSGWIHHIIALIGHWRLNWRINRQAKAIAREIYPALWEQVRRKLAGASEQDLTAYAKVRAAQLSQERVDVLMKADPELPGAYATQLLLATTGCATEMVLAAARARRSAA